MNCDCNKKHPFKAPKGITNRNFLHLNNFKYRLTMVYVSLGGLGLFVLDRIFHVFGICIGF